MEKKKKGIVLVIVALIIIAIGVFFLISRNDKKYTVQFEGTEIENIEVLDGNYLKKPADPVKTGYTFVGWYLNGEPFDFTKPIEGDIKLEAKWEEEIKLTDEIYTITFDTDGGSKVESQNINGNGKVVKPINPTKENSTFIEWQLDGVVYNFETLVTKSIELKAVWKEPGKVTIIFDTDGGSEITTQVIYENGVVTNPKTKPVKEGYKFMSWQLGGVDYDFTKEVNTDLTLKATWEKLPTYKVTFNTDGGSSVAEKTVYEGSKVVKPTNPTKTGYIFVSWQLDGANYDFDKVVQKDITLKATWRETRNFTVTFDSNGGSDVASKTIVEGAKVTKPTDPTKEGYTLKAWQLNGVDYDFTKGVTKAITLKAVWKQKSYTVTIQIIDSTSNPSRKLVIKQGTQVISDAQTIKTMEGVKLGFNINKTVVSKLGDKVKVVLKNGTVVTATLIK